MKTVRDESSRHNQNTNSMSSDFFPKKNFVCEKMWKNMTASDRLQVLTHTHCILDI